MRWSFDFIPFLAIAGFLHVLFFWNLSDDGISAGGVGGDRSVSLMAIAATAEAMVAEWERPPQTAVEVPDIVAPALKNFEAAPMLRHQISAAAKITISAVVPIDGAATSPDAIASAVPNQIAPALPELSKQAPQLAMASPAQVVSRPLARQERQIRRVTPAQALTQQTEVSSSLPTIDTTAPPPLPRAEVKPKPTPKEQPKKKTTKRVEKASTAIAGRAAQKAAGRGGQKNAGANGTKAENSISGGKQKSLMRAWQSRIQRRIEQRKRQPKGRHSGGKVVLVVSIDRNGNVLSKRVSRSSGISAYDQAALATINRAGRFPAAPKGLPGNKFNFSVPLTYK